MQSRTQISSDKATLMTTDKNQFVEWGIKFEITTLTLPCPAVSK